MTDAHSTQLFEITQGLQQSAILLLELSDLVTQEHDSAELIDLISTISQKNLSRALDYLHDNQDVLLTFKKFKDN